MSKIVHDGDQDPNLHSDLGANGVLEDTFSLTCEASQEARVDRAEINAGGRTVATLGGPCSREHTRSFDDGLVCRLSHWETLLWSQWAALMVSEGAEITKIFPATVFLLDAKHRAAWAPVPGADDVTVVEVLLNPNNASAAEIFIRLKS